MKWTNAFSALLLAALIPVATHAQTAAPQTQTGAPQVQSSAPAAQAANPGITDIAGSFYKTFTTKSVTGNGINQASTDSYGGLFELRHIQSPWLGYEFTFSVNPDNQTLTPIPGSCGFFCNNPTETLNLIDTAFSLDYIASKQYGSLRAFALGGFGFTIGIPGGIPYTYLSLPVKPTYIGGAGVDWALTHKLGIRLQYRENIFTAPHIDPRYPNVGLFTPEGQPMFGVYYRINNLFPLQ
jgi:opacity protein-like surface antigen